MIKNRLVKLYLITVSVIFFPVTLSYLFSTNKKIIREDVKVTNEHWRVPWRGVLGLMYQMIKNRYFRNIFYMRVGRSLYLTQLFFPKDKYFIISKNIGPGFYPAHPFATIINAQSVGKCFSCRQNTTVGNKRDGERVFPRIGDNVTLGANVVVIGDITIGNNVIVGAGSIVVRDIPDNSIAVGNPAKIIKKIL